MGNIDDVREEIQRTLERYFDLEAQLQLLEGDRFRVCIFGSARLRPEDPTYQMVYRMARLLAELDIDIVTGGGPGLMEAANRAVRDAQTGVQSIGLTIHLPNLNELANKHLDIKSEHRRFSSRLDEFMRMSNAVIVAPGGIGTMLELMYVWQLLQVGMVPERTVILLDRSLWQPLLEWMRDNLLARKFVCERDFDWIHCVDTPEEALRGVELEIEKFRREQAARPEGEERAEQAVRMLSEIERRWPEKRDLA
jgi:uncharacterized protein (TIGR00730 family)